MGWQAFVKASTGDGVVVMSALPQSRLPESIVPASIFARCARPWFAQLRGLDPKDRVSPVLAALSATSLPCCGDLLVEHADSEHGKPLAALARGFGNALRGGLRKQGLMTAQIDARLPRLQIALLGGTDMLLGASTPPHADSDWPGGIPRLRMLRDAPSRSALKLEEALLVLLDTEERARWLKPGQQAVDLGAAPGGWSWVLARHQLRVTAIDNGPMAASAMDTGLIEHVRADGFAWLPRKPVDWMVCDMVEQPIRVAQRMATWLRDGWCRHAIFNLKLPMRKRHAEVIRCLDLIRGEVAEALELRARHLYHDREEITVYARLRR